ncbi:MAG: hypothetical protein EOO36_06370 [Cytophagaceae bacterium]|nr:MAG: hypothetical protein EOO36_06370 [Cytophagaceae bacterium]
MTLCATTQYVHYLSPTEGGRQHEKRLADDYALPLPAGCVLGQNLELPGHAPAGVVVERPHKKPIKRGLTFPQQLYNQPLSLLHVFIEHAFSSIRRLRMMADTVRRRGEWRRDMVLVMACGLHNLRVRSSLRTYPAPVPAKFSMSSE